MSKSNSKVKVFQPQYFKDFICTGTKCVYNCCNHNWQIRVDKNTYDKYVNLGDDGKEILDNIKVLKEDPFLALITKGEDNKCFFLNENELCNLQLTRGYDYLCRTCRIHPRNISYINGEFETFLELSCEEAAKAVLFNQEHLDFEEGVLEPDGCGNYIPNHMLTAEKYTSARNGADVFNKLRSASVAIIQSRQYKMRVRMMILCLFIQQVSEQLTAGSDENIPLFTKVFVDALNTGVYDSIVDELPDGIDLDFGIALSILRDIETKNNKRFNDLLQEAFDAFLISSLGVPDDFPRIYKEHYRKYFSDKEYIFENYVVNNMLMLGFPFNYGKEGDVMNNFADLLSKYNLVEFLLTGVCEFHKKFDKWNIINCVSAFSRYYDNSLKGYLMYE